MGRIKTKQVKAITHELQDKYGDEFKDNFEDNKVLVSSKLSGTSKKLRNIIAGYVTRLQKSNK
ncbi:MAG: 30S ribosomal protein S17e [Candidatus Woesearchaeota archaeon]